MERVVERILERVVERVLERIVERAVGRVLERNMERSPCWRSENTRFTTDYVVTIVIPLWSDIPHGKCVRVSSSEDDNDRETVLRILTTTTESVATRLPNAPHSHDVPIDNSH